MTQRSFRLLAASMALASCERDADPVRQLIDSVIQEGVVATRDQNIDAYIALIPEGSVIYDDTGAMMSREQLRANVLRDWSIIEGTLEITALIDSLNYHGDSAIAYTSQTWRRRMFRRDGITLDTVLTTQRHRESWRPTAAGWRNFVTQELGGSVTINGVPYQP